MAASRAAAAPLVAMPLAVAAPAGLAGLAGVTVPVAVAGRVAVARAEVRLTVRAGRRGGRAVLIRAVAGHVTRATMRDVRPAQPGAGRHPAGVTRRSVPGAPPGRVRPTAAAARRV